MSNKKDIIEQRLYNMKNFYLNAEKLIENLPVSFPNDIKVMLKDAILGDKDLKEFMNGIDSHRPPRILLIGRTGVGKSSLINAICGFYTAKVSDVRSCTETAEIYKVTDNNRVLLEILDTRGIAESEPLDSQISAEQMLINQINEFSPDVALFMLNCTHRDDVDSDVDFLKNVARQYLNVNSVSLPIITVINKCDEMAPSRFKNPAEYPENKISKIDDVVKYYKEIIIKRGLKVEKVIAVSSLIDWMTSDGIEIDVEDISNLPKKDIESLEIAFDGRYNIEELLDILEEAIQDIGAQMGLRMAARLEEVINRIANNFNNIFSGISATIALTPIPVSDIYILVTLQTILVVLIASLSGREISLETAKEFILSMGGLAGMGYALKLTAQQAVKFLNGFWPGAGSLVSSGIAGAGTLAIGKAAITYYLQNESIVEAKKKFNTERNK